MKCESLANFINLLTMSAFGLGMPGYVYHVAWVCLSLLCVDLFFQTAVPLLCNVESECGELCHESCEWVNFFH